MATYPHVKLTAAGTLGSGGGNEIWSCGMKAVVVATGAPNVPLAPTKADLDALATGMAPLWATYIQRDFGQGPVSGLFSDNVCLSYTKAAAVLTTGKDDGNIDSSIQDVAANIRGKATAAMNDFQGGQMPYQVALVATLKGDSFLRKGAAYGRCYLPVPNLHVITAAGGPTRITDGLVQGSSIAAHITAFSVLLDGINAIALAGGRDAYVANISQSTGAAGLRFQKVSHVYMDNRPDTVRRRSNKIGGNGRVTVALA